MTSSATHWSEGFFGSLYEELYRRYLLDAERTQSEVAFASSVLQLSGKQILDLAAGFGRHARLLARANRVVALDQNRQYLVSACRGLRGRTRDNLLAVHADMRRLPFADASFDDVLLLFNSFGYFTQEPPEREQAPTAEGQLWKLPEVFYQKGLVPETFGGHQPLEQPSPAADQQPNASKDPNVAVLEEVARVLRDRGGFLLDIPNPEPLIAAVLEAPRRRVVASNYEIEEEYSFDPATNILSNRTRFRLGKREEGGQYKLRLYRHAELREMLTSASFKVKKVYGGYEGQAFRSRSSEVLLVHAVKNG